LQKSSPGINAGNIKGVPDWLKVDFSGSSRVANYQIDIGIFEKISEITPKTEAPLKNQIFETETSQIKLTVFNINGG
jgi:hypothetical protein